MNNRNSQTMLGIVKNYLETENITNKSFVLSKDLFDNAFNEVILAQLSYNYNPEKFGLPTIYEIRIDDNNNPYFYVVSDSNNKLVILMDGVKYGDIKAKKMPENTFMYTLEDHLDNTSDKGRILHGTNWLGNNDHYGIQHRFTQYGYAICLAIKEYLMRDTDSIQITYDKHPSELFVPDPNYAPIKREEIPLDTRLQILRNKKLSIESTAMKSNSDTISYYLFLYNNVCSGSTLIMEPLHGYKSTRCIFFGNPITIKKLPSIASYYLSLNYNELLKESAVTIHKHSNPNKFNKLVSYVTGDRIYSIPYYVRDRIDMAIEEGRINKGLH